ALLAQLLGPGLGLHDACSESRPRQGVSGRSSDGGTAALEDGLPAPQGRRWPRRVLVAASSRLDGPRWAAGLALPDLPTWAILVHLGLAAPRWLVAWLRSSSGDRIPQGYWAICSP